MEANRTVQIALVFCLAFSFFSCKKNPFETEGQVVTVERFMGHISEITATDRINIVLVQDTIEQLFLTGPKNLLDNVLTKQVDSELILTDNNTKGWYSGFNSSITAKIHIRQLREIYYEGIGDIWSANTLQIDSLFINSQASSGNINLTIEGEYFYCYFNHSSADISIAGEVNHSHLQIYGTGFIKAEKLKAKSCWVHNQGAGDIYTYASESIAGFIEGSGNVIYGGNPVNTLFEVKDRGTGKFINGEKKK